MMKRRTVIFVTLIAALVIYISWGYFCFTVGNLYAEGKFFGKSYVTAVKWYEKAAHKGLTEAQVMAGNLYYSGGYGLSRNYKKADLWYRVALGGQFTSRSVWDKMLKIADGIYITDPNDPLDVSLALLELTWNFISDERIRSIEGEGLLNLADISSKEIEEVKAEAQRILAASNEADLTAAILIMVIIVPNIYFTLRCYSRLRRRKFMRPNIP